MRLVHFFYLLLIGSLTISCSSNRQLSRPKAQAEDLTQKFGFKINRKDNLALYTKAGEWLGVPYRYGGTTPQGIDCSALVGRIYQQVYARPLQRHTEDIARKDCRRIGKHSLKPGDLVFFNTSTKKRKGINHVGLFLKDGHFIHASTSKGVIISNLRENYYKKAWKQGGRVK